MPDVSRGTSATTRQRKLSCEPCGYVVRCSRAMIARGLPVCPCGELLMPAALEDAVLAHEHGHLSAEQLAEHPENVMLTRELSSVLRGQSSHLQRGRSTRQPEDVAWQRVMADRHAAADLARLAALHEHSPFIDHAAAQADAEMPF